MYLVGTPIWYHMPKQSVTPWGTTFGSVSAFSLDKSSKNIQKNVHAYKHDLKPVPIHCMTSGFAPLALSLRLKYSAICWGGGVKYHRRIFLLCCISSLAHHRCAKLSLPITSAAWCHLEKNTIFSDIMVNSCQVNLGRTNWRTYLYVRTSLECMYILESKHMSKYRKMHIGCTTYCCLAF